MNKVIEALYNLAENGDDRAAKHLMNMETLGGEQLAQYVAENDTALQEILGLNTSIMSNPDEFDKSLQDAYYALRNTGVTAYTGDKKTDIYGRPMHSLDEFMGEFGMAPNDSYSISDDDRAFFTNPKHPNYWKNRPENERAAIARKMGFADVRELDDYLDREAKDFQHRQAVEGYDENNKANRWWLPSAAAGIFTPRVKEAKLAGRPVGARDVVGDVTENAVSMVPGFGSTKLLTRGAARLPAGKVASMVEKAVPVVGATVDQVAQPLASQALDAGILYNPSLAGSPEDTLNLRSEFSPGEVAGQVGGIIGAKGAIKGGAGMAKNFLETRYGNQVGGQGFRGILGIVENVNEKTDDLIARRQAVLDRKAELAKRGERTKFIDDVDIATANPSLPEDLYDADNFRILNEEAERIARSEPERKAYKRAELVRERGKWAENKMRPLNDEFGQEINKLERMELDGADPDLIDIQRDKVTAIGNRLGYLQKQQREGFMKDAFTMRTADIDAAGKAYKAANERGASDIVQLPDGRFIYSNRLMKPDLEGYPFRSADFVDPNIIAEMTPMPDQGYAIQYPGANYRVDVPTGTKPVLFAYDGEGSMKLSPLTKGDFVPAPGGFAVSRNPAVIEKIQADDLLRRKLNPGTTFRNEALRDIAFNDAFNIMAREGVGGVTTATDLRGKRERARWNSMLGKLRTITADPAIPIEERRRNADAIMNVMQYGLDGLPAELYLQSPETYRMIANKLGVSNWKHFSERDIQPTNSSSRAD